MQPTPKDYTSLCQWMKDNNVEYVQTPFEADAQMKQMIIKGRATAASREDGDLVVYKVEHIMLQANISILDPKKSTCQYFDMSKLKAGKYHFTLTARERLKILSESLYLAGNEYISLLVSF